MNTIDALVIIDMQKAYFETEPLANQKTRLATNCNQLVEYFTQQHKPIFMVRTVHQRDRSTWTLSMLEDNQGYLFEGDEHTEAIDELDELDAKRAIEVIKLRDSAFFETNLKELLDESRIKSIAICGVSTQNCILQTAVDAYSYNLRVTIVKDAIASTEPSFQDTVLRMLAKDYRQDIVRVDDIISA
jgi:nicotinamidase-related amidase